MGSAFPPDRMAECGIPYIPAIEGSLIVSCEICQTDPLALFNPVVPIPPPPSFDFGCYPLQVEMDIPDPDEPDFLVEVVYLDFAEVGYCKPKLIFKTRVGGCGTIEVKVAATEEITLSGYQTVDGVETEYGDRVLATAQPDARDNDVWIVYGGSWQRYPTATRCNLILSRFGDNNARTLWQMDNEDEPEHGSDEIAFSKLSGSQLTCRVRYLLYADTTLTGLIDVDGVTLEEGNLVAVDFSPASDPLVRAKTGIYVASADPWTQIWKVDPAALPAEVPALPVGAIVTIWDGYSYPWIYVVGLRWTF